MREKKKGKTSQIETKEPELNRFLKKEYLVLVGIFVLALVVRIHLDPNIPYHYDPGKNIVYARAALDSFPLVPQYNPYFNLGEYYEYQVLFPYTIAFLHLITGFSLTDLTAWLAIIAGAAICLSTYFLALEIFRNKTAALVSAFLIATSLIQLLAYVNYYPQILAMALMPIAFVYLIRSVRHQNFTCLFLVALLSSLITLASYIAGFVYFAIVFVSLGIWSFRDKKTVGVFILIPLMTAALLAFFWVPIMWRYGILNFIESALRILFTPTVSPFTNQPFTLINFLEFSTMTIIIIILGLGAFLLLRKIPWNFEQVLLSSWLVITLILMGSYLFKPLLWVDRYSQFFDIALLVLAGGIFAFLIKKLGTLRGGLFAHKQYFLLLLLLIPLFEAMTMGITFGKWGYPSDINMTRYMQILPAKSLVVTPAGVDGFWFSAAAGVHILGGESSQMIGNHYLGDKDSNIIINDPNPDRKMELIRKYGVNYVVIPYHTSQYLMWNTQLNKSGIDAFNNPSYFEVITFFKDDFGSTVLLKVKENLVSRYQKEDRNWGVTITGYLVSIVSILGFVYVMRRESNGTTL